MTNRCSRALLRDRHYHQTSGTRNIDGGQQEDAPNSISRSLNKGEVRPHDAMVKDARYYRSQR
jgi:hypothetical protein